MSKQRQVGNYIIGESLGKGTFSEVFKGQHADTKETVAIKIISKRHLKTKEMQEQLNTEIKILGKLNHPNVIAFREALESDNNVYLVTEFINGLELYEKVNSEGSLEELDAYTIFSQLLEALDYCHSKGVCHRDLKPENILITPENRVVLCDFGLGILEEVAGQASNISQTAGTVHYLAPEMCNIGRGYDARKTDVWALGVNLFAMLAAQLPFEADSNALMFQKITAARYFLPSWISVEAISILQAMLQPDPSKRATTAQLKSHKWCLKQAKALAHQQRKANNQSPTSSSESSPASSGPSTPVAVDTNERQRAILELSDIVMGGSFMCGYYDVPITRDVAQQQESIDAEDEDLASKDQITPVTKPAPPADNDETEYRNEPCIARGALATIMCEF